MSDEDVMRELIESQRAGIERLTFQVQLGANLTAEIERLRQFEQAWKAQGVEIAKLVNELRDARSEAEWLTKVLTDIHDDGRCPSWLCQHIEVILGGKGC